eukprot:TRINITY_DN18686_c0_g1_i1.p1 TRINITY_DN18686_c0_g1~~TRINITY_DN18686_c0_g1_i1.p1  ORF type:complete len:356 (-),score=74.36 TRINITY_DN18686_c0_g1_i1:284-1351(-)
MRLSRSAVLAAALAAGCDADYSVPADVVHEVDAQSHKPWAGTLVSTMSKTLGATLTGSFFAVVGMLVEVHKAKRVRAQVKESDGAIETMPSTSCSERKGDSMSDSKSESEVSRITPSMSMSPLSASRKDLSEAEKTERQIKSILNKLTLEKFDILYVQLLDHCKVPDQAVRASVIDVIARELFKKATMQHNFIKLYADVCSRLEADLKKNKLEVNFRRTLLDQCQQSFSLYLQPPVIDEGLGYDEHYEELVKYKTKMIGNVRFIGHLLKSGMLAAKILFTCTEELVSIGSNEALETLCAFLETVGATFDKADWAGYERLRSLFLQVELFSRDSQKSARIRYLLKDLLDKRKANWT